MRSNPLALLVPILVLACGASAGGQAASLAPGAPTPLEAAAARVCALIETPDPRSIDDAFSKSFLSQVSAEKLQATLLQAHAIHPCSLDKVLASGSDRSGTVHLTCATGGIDVTLETEPVAPYKITLLILKPRS